MANEKEVSGGLEWRVTVPESASVKVEPEFGALDRAWIALIGVMNAIVWTVASCERMVWKLGADDPRKVVHGIKVGVALSLVSLFYYTRPLYDGLGGAAMWAVMTVVVVFEFSIGGCLYKGINRCIATFSAGALAIGIHWIAGKSGHNMEPFIISCAVFLLASAATFSRFIPTIKLKFDYGITIFILTFSLVVVSGYRVDKLLALAEQRLSTIAIGISICLLVAFIFPVWSGSDLHFLVTKNMDKLADSLEACVEEYFKDDKTSDKMEAPSQKSQGYKCVLNSKASEDSLTNLAKWEPAHGQFGFRHPWGHYQKISAAMRSCAYCIEALNGCINSGFQAGPESVKECLSGICIRLSSECSKVLKELSTSIKSMQRSRTIDLLVNEMYDAVQELHDSLVHTPVVPEALSLITITSLLVEIATRAEGVVDAVEKLAVDANFKEADDQKPDKIDDSKAHASLI